MSRLDISRDSGSYSIPHPITFLLRNRRPKTRNINYYWHLDRNLCEFLKIPYYEQSSNISLATLRSFICTRLTPAIEPTKAQRDQEKIIYQSLHTLDQVIYAMTYREMDQRSEYIMQGIQ